MNNILIPYFFSLMKFPHQKMLHHILIFIKQIPIDCKEKKMQHIRSAMIDKPIYADESILIKIKSIEFFFFSFIFECQNIYAK